MIGIPREYVTGRLYHCDWAKNRGMVWRLIDFNSETNYARLITPRTKKELITKLSSLRDTNATILENNSNKSLEN